MHPPFQKLTHKYPKDTDFGLHTIFRFYTLDNRLVYWKVTACYDNGLIDVCECSKQGVKARYPDFRRGIARQEILNMIYADDWYIYELCCLRPSYTALPAPPCLPTSYLIS